MRRRDFLRTSGIAATALGASKVAGAAVRIAKPAIVSNPLHLALCSPWPRGRGGYPDRAGDFVRALQLAAGPGLRVRTREHAASGIDCVTTGAADICLGPAQDNVAHHPALGFFAGLPGHSSMSPHDLRAWIAEGGGQPLLDEMSARFGVKCLLAGHSGPTPGFWSTRRIRSLADFSGQQIYAAGLGREVVRGLGATPAMAQAGDVAGQLARSEIFAAEWGGLTHSLAAGFPAVAKFCSTTAIALQGSAWALTIRRSVWDGMEPSLQEVIAHVATQHMSRSVLDASASHDIMRRALAETLQIEFVALPADTAAAIDRISGAIVADAATKDELSARINRSYLDFRRRPPRMA